MRLIPRIRRRNSFIQSPPQQIMQGAFEDPARQETVIEKEVQKRPLVNLLLSLDDEPQSGKDAEIHFYSYRLPELISEIGDQSISVDGRRNAATGFERFFSGKHILLSLAFLQFLPFDLALPFGENDQSPKHHEEGDGAAVQVHCV